MHRITGTPYVLRCGALLLVAMLCGISVWSASGKALRNRVPDCVGTTTWQLEVLLEEVARIELPGQAGHMLRLDTYVQRGVHPGCVELLGRRLRLNWYRPGAVMVRTGQVWQMQARLRAPRGFANPGGFDYPRWLMANGYSATGYVRIARLAEPRQPGVRARAVPSTHLRAHETRRKLV